MDLRWLYHTHGGKLLLIAGATLALTLVLRLGVTHLFDLQLDPRYWYRDYFGNFAVSLFCYGITQSGWRSLLLSSVIIAGFQFSNAGKLVVLGTPISPDDFINVRNLFLLWEGWMLWAMVLTVTVPLLLLFWLIRWRHPLTWTTIAVTAALTVLTAQFSRNLQPVIDEQFGNSVWNQPENYQRRGLVLHIVQESVRTLAKLGELPSRSLVQSVSAELPVLQPSLGDLPQRNVHMIVLETFFDPMSLGPEWVAEDPLPQSFRELWAATGNSTVKSPVFGGYTANAEFEALCGFPVTEHAVFFEGWLRRPAPCLPAVLADAGYRTVASHPNVAGFWNRTHAYRLVGFDTYWSKADYDLTESAGNFLLDHSYYEQTFDLLEKNAADRPLFNYMLTIYGHLPYPEHPRYPVRIEPEQDSALLQGYLTHVYYKSRDLMKMLEDLRKRDPSALIVLFGDHLPYLGPNYAIYDDVLGLPADRNDFTASMFDFLVSTPLIIIDGERGPINTGDVPLYRLPALILELLGAGDDAGILAWTRNPPAHLVRPVYGMHYAIDEAGQAVVCPPEDIEREGCVESHRWMERTRLLAADIFSGEQFSLEWFTTDKPVAAP